MPFLHHCDSRGGLHQPVCACLLHPNFLWSVPFGHLGCIIVFGLRFWGFPFGAELVCHSLRNYPDFCQECAVLRDRPFGKAQSLYAWSREISSFCSCDAAGSTVSGRLATCGGKEALRQLVDTRQSSLDCGENALRKADSFGFSLVLCARLFCNSCTFACATRSVRFCL